MSGDDAVDLVLSKSEYAVAFRAGDVQRLQFYPSEWYLELCAAIVRDADLYSVSFRHGWPILSVDDVATSTVTEAGGESILAREGGAA